MKVYFTAAISQSDHFGSSYQRIVKLLTDQGHKVQHDHITDETMDKIKAQSDDDLLDHYNKTIKRITATDLFVSEASFPSTLNVGHEITIALERSKPVIVLYKKGYKSYFLNGLDTDRMFLIEYTDDNLETKLEEAIEAAKNTADTRFNFFISPRHQHYLDWIAKKRRIPRSVYLRNLIKRDMEHNEGYSGWVSRYFWAY